MAGIDENGLGPKLGFFCVTAVLIECDEYNAEIFWKANRGFVADSKDIMSSRNILKGLDIVKHFTGSFAGRSPASANDFLESVSFRPLAAAKSRCPRHCAEMCWEPDFTFPSGQGYSRKPDFGIAGAALRGVYVSYICPREFNRRCAKASKFAVEFSLVEELLEFLCGKFGKGIHYFCGKLGGTAKYEKFFGYLKKFAIKEKSEGKDSFYVLENFGRVEFIRSAEKAHFPVALASVYGKVVREIFIKRLNLFFGSRGRDLPVASGYNDPVTRKFIEKTERLREKLKIPKDCFLRIK
ncbi:MAG: hypothetical protein J7L54_07030 [Elusimicrobia bacterium]|nr:hypothetical protein [Elusimicrobiota bacterium]